MLFYKDLRNVKFSVKLIGSFIGGVILPGLRTSLDALVSNAAQLSQTSLTAPKKVIGKNTLDCMKGGMIYGNAASIDGMIERMEEELGCKCTIVSLHRC